MFLGDLFVQAIGMKHAREENRAIIIIYEVLLL